jgi:hypothetical protein
VAEVVVVVAAAAVAVVAAMATVNVVKNVGGFVSLMWCILLCGVRVLFRWCGC